MARFGRTYPSSLAMIKARLQASIIQVDYATATETAANVTATAPPVTESISLADSAYVNTVVAVFDNLDYIDTAATRFDVADGVSVVEGSISIGTGISKPAADAVSLVDSAFISIPIYGTDVIAVVGESARVIVLSSEWVMFTDEGFPYGDGLRATGQRVHLINPESRVYRVPPDSERGGFE